jgi:SWI/SNF-related matrix-associated actin-dependent regulator 1 of chromatin subfamily A
MSKNNNNNNMSRDLECILSKLRPFQREAFDFATAGKTSNRQWNDDTPHKQKNAVQLDPNLLGKGRILLADEMGLGKSITSLAIMTHYKPEWPLLILCPASLRHAWPAEIEKFLPTLPSSAVYVVSGFDDTAFLKRRKEIQIVVATYSLLQTRSAAARVLQQFDFQCVIADESHNLKEKSSQRCQLGLPLLQKAKRLVLLSGTPALARPVELWAQVSCIAPQLFGSYTAYTKQYCNAKRGRFGWDVSGISNANELHFKLRQIMVRRLKSNVLTELPAKQRCMIPIQILDKTIVQQCRQGMQELQNAKVSVNELVGQDARDANFEHRRLLMQAYQQSGHCQGTGRVGVSSGLAQGCRDAKDTSLCASPRSHGYHGNGHCQTVQGCGTCSY